MAEDDNQPATKGDIRRMESRLTARLDRMDAARERDLQGVEDELAEIRGRVNENEQLISRHSGIFWLFGILLVGIVGWLAEAGAGVIG